MKKGRIVFRALIILFIGAVVGYSLYSWNASKLIGNKLPTPFGIGVSVVLSGSMEPTLSVNDLIVVKVSDDYKEDDVVVFQDGGDLVIHRIISRDGETFVTQGDANNIPDDPINLKQIKGRLVLSVPFVGSIIRGMKTLPGIIIILALSFWLMHRSWSNEKREKQAELDSIKREIERLKAQTRSENKNANEKEGDAPPPGRDGRTDGGDEDKTDG